MYSILIKSLLEYNFLYNLNRFKIKSFKPKNYYFLYINYEFRQKKPCLIQRNIFKLKYQSTFI